MLTQLEVDLADMYTGRTVEVGLTSTHRQDVVLTLSSQYLERSSAHIVTDLVHTAKRTSTNVTGVEGRESLFSGTRSSPGW